MPKKKSSHLPNVFYPLMDWWVAFGVCLLLIMIIVTIPLLLWSLSASWQALAGVIVLLISALYIIDLAFFTSYHLEEEGLIIHNNLRRIFFPYRAMDKIQNGNILGLISVGRRKRYALSARNLKIKLVDSIWREIFVSPKEQQIFLNQLLENIDKERSKQTTMARQDI